MRQQPVEPRGVADAERIAEGMGVKMAAESLDGGSARGGIGADAVAEAGEFCQKPRPVGTFGGLGQPGGRVEADPGAGRISPSSPIGRSLIGKAEGDEVEVRAPSGVREYELIRLQTMYDQVEESAGDS